MSCFFVVSAPAHRRAEAAQTFGLGLRGARELLEARPQAQFQADGMLAATFSRHDGSGGEMAIAPNRTGCMVSSGTWFHEAITDQEVLLGRIHEVGPLPLARELDSTFVIVHLDVREGRVTAFTDIFGTGRCYLRDLDGIVALSSSSLLLASLAPADLDPVGAQEFLYTGNIYENRTLYRQVEKPGPAGSVAVEADEIRRPRRYWTVEEVEPGSRGGDAASAALSASLREAARRIGRRFPNPICDLTGGYDSRLVVSQFLEAGVDFTTTVAGQPHDPDVTTAQALAAAVGLELTIVPSRPEITFDRLATILRWTDGEHDLLSFRRIADVHLQLLDPHDISVNGSLGELARGHRYELVRPWLGRRQPLDAHHAARRLFATHRHDASVVAAAHRLDLVEHVANIVERTVEPLAEYPNSFQLDHAANELIMGVWHGRIASSTDRIRPLVSPFGFRNVAETAMAIRGEDQLRSLLIRRLLANREKRWTKIPYADGRPAVPLRLDFQALRSLAGNFRRRLAAKTGLAPCPYNTHSSPGFRLQLWRDGCASSLLRAAENLHATGLFDSAKLCTFLERSRHVAFDFHDQWSRLLTLEYTLGRLEHSRARRWTEAA